jgi:hypothetical protein
MRRTPPTTVKTDDEWICSSYDQLLNYGAAAKRAAGVLRDVLKHFGA